MMKKNRELSFEKEGGLFVLKAGGVTVIKFTDDEAREIARVIINDLGLKTSGLEHVDNFIKQMKRKK